MASKAKPGKTVGVYDRPDRAKWPKIAAIVVVVVIVIAIGVLLMGRALAAESAIPPSMGRSGLALLSIPPAR